MIGRGKIDRLPRDIRDQLNRRLGDGQPGAVCLAWLNSLPQVRELLAQHFEGRPVNKQNLSDWTARHYPAWQAGHQAVAQPDQLPADAPDIAGVTAELLSDHLAAVLAGRYAAALAGWNGQVSEGSRRMFSALHGLCQDVVALRRAGHNGARLRLQSEQMRQESKKTGEKQLERFGPAPGPRNLEPSQGQSSPVKASQAQSRLVKASQANIFFPRDHV